MFTVLSSFTAFKFCKTLLGTTLYIVAELQLQGVGRVDEVE